MLASAAPGRLTRRNAAAQQPAPDARAGASGGAGALQQLLERGFDTFAGLRGAEAFLEVITTRERALAARLFAAVDVTPTSADDPLVQLP